MHEHFTCTEHIPAESWDRLHWAGVARGIESEAERLHFGPSVSLEFWQGWESLFWLKGGRNGLCWFGDKWGGWSMQIVAGIWTVSVCMGMSVGREDKVSIWMGDVKKPWNRTIVKWLFYLAPPPPPPRILDMSMDKMKFWREYQRFL